MIDQSSARPIVFVWDNFGPGHCDRAEAVAQAGTRRVVGIEITGRSADYDWTSDARSSFTKITLSKTGSERGSIAWRLLRTVTALRPQSIFFCQYERLSVFLAALWCRLLGAQVFAMGDSKFDDYPRALARELGKRLLYLPYLGALTGSRRSADYLRFLGVPSRRIARGYNAVSTDRLRRQGGEPASFSDRHFTVVARLIPKKNIPLVLEAFARVRADGVDRRLVVCGSGPLETALKALASDLGIGSHVDFLGFVDSATVARRLASTLALILPSTEEQFGQAIAEAVVMGAPVIVSDNCGARDALVRTGVNGFVVEPDNVEGLAWLMSRLAEDETLWRGLAQGCAEFAPLADLSAFVDGCGTLMGESLSPAPVS